MNKLNKAIADVAYILDTLMAYRDIAKTGNCNTCNDRDCKYKPKPGQVAVFNCPFYVGEGDQP